MKRTKYTKLPCLTLILFGFLKNMPSPLPLTDRVASPSNPVKIQFSWELSSLSGCPLIDNGLPNYQTQNH